MEEEQAWQDIQAKKKLERRRVSSESENKKETCSMMVMYLRSHNR